MRRASDRPLRPRLRLRAVVAVAVVLAAFAVTPPTGAATAPRLDLKVLLIGGPAGDPTTDAWVSALQSQGVPFTLARGSGSPGSETVTLPTLVDPADSTHALYNGVVVADDPAAFGSGQLSSVFSFEQTFGVRQVDGYVYPRAAYGLTPVTSGDVSGTTDQLTADGKTTFPGLKGPVPLDAGTYGYGATADPTTVTPLLTDAAGDVTMSVYTHPTGTSDPQAGVQELTISFDYNAHQLHWLLLSPGLIDWVSSDVHLGLYRNYFGQDVDDVFLSDNEWSRQYQCTPADPTDYSCPAGVTEADAPPDAIMSATDVNYVVNWQKSTGIKLEMAYNAVGACTSSGGDSKAVCDGSTTINGTTYTLPGHVTDASYPDDAAMVNALVGQKGSFSWVNHTWSHAFLGCVTYQRQPMSAATAGANGQLPAATYSYMVTAVTSYGESEPSVPVSVDVPAGGSAQLSWPDAPNAGGPSLAQLSTRYVGGSGFWGYRVYRLTSAGTYGLVGAVPENPQQATYSFTDTGATTPGEAPGSGPTHPTATNPAIDCATWYPRTTASGPESLDQQIGLNAAFAAANKLPSYHANALVTGEHSGLESPFMPQALADTGITAVAADASRQPTPYTLSYGGSTASTAPRYPSNIYYNASNWPDELNEYNTLYVQQGSSIGDPSYPSDTGRCTGSAVTTCRTTPATEADVLASENRIMLGHVLGNDARMHFAHQSNLVGPATQGGADYGYTLLKLLSQMSSSYKTWCNAPLQQITDADSAQVLAEQQAWAAASSAGTVTGYVQNGTVYLTNNGSSTVAAPLTTPTYFQSTATGTSFGKTYAGHESAWVSLPPGTTLSWS